MAPIQINNELMRPVAPTEETMNVEELRQFGAKLEMPKEAISINWTI